MNSTGHLVASVVKSAIRILACVWCLFGGSVAALCAGLAVAELLGILEELVDDRK